MVYHGSSGSDSLVSCVAHLQVTAVDADSGINAAITYSIEPGSNSTIVDSNFVVDSNSGEVRLNAALTPGDVNASYDVTVRATDAGTQPLSTSVRLCATVVDRNVSANHLRSVPHHRLEIGSLVLDTTVSAALLGSSALCAFIVIVVGAALVTKRRARTRRRRQLNHYKNPSHSKLVDICNGTHEEEITGKRHPMNEDNVDNDDGCSTQVPRTVIRTLDCSPRSCRSTDVGTRRSCAATPTIWKGKTQSRWRRREPEGHTNLNHFDIEPSHTGSSNV